ncbi:restriction endonuclease subunit S [Campylobacter sp. RM16191]|uniref:restriction endonuclease subunit S n=1 Tax=Campylobacter sp. RM16191 TaxID=1705728 RepID=UPI001472B141|nr:restriction endonuclease subunit S [Campylobacter sp. RM16191]
MNSFKNLPSGWRVVRLGDVAPLQRGYDLPISNLIKGDFPVVYSNGILNYHNTFKAERPGVVTGRSGTIGKVFYIDENYWPHNTSLWVTDFYGNYPKFIYYMYSNLHLNRLSAGSTVPTLNRNDIHEIIVLMPPLKEQEKIAEILSTWDKAINLTAELIKSKKEFKKGLMQNLLTSKIRLPNFNDDWQEVILKDIGYSFNGLSGKKAENFGIGNARYITYKNVFDNSKIDINIFDNVEVAQNEVQNLVKFGDIFFTISSETPEEVGMTSVLLDEVFETYLNSFCFGFRLNDFNILSPDFARFYFRSGNIRSVILKLAQGSTRFNVSKSRILDLKIKIPCKTEQQKIAEILTACDDEIKILENKLESLKTQKQGLMQNLLTGKVRT